MSNRETEYDYCSGYGNDYEFLGWLFARLVHVHNENPNYDYMHKLKSIIEARKEIR